VSCATKAEVIPEHWRLRDVPFGGHGVDVIQSPKLEHRIMRYELRDYEWTAITPMLPNKLRGVLPQIQLTAETGVQSAALASLFGPGACSTPCRRG